MTIFEIIWSDDRLEHIADHAVTSKEFEEVCFGYSLALRGKSEGKSPVYYVLGKTNFGRLLFCVIIQFPDGNGYPVTARSMTVKERQRYKRWREK